MLEPLLIPDKGTRSVFDYISISREAIRHHAVMHDYDWLLWLDTDTIPVHLKALDELLKTAERLKLASICGLYCYKETRQPVYTASWGDNPSFDTCISAAEQDIPIPIAGGGLGCCLQHKSAFSAASFLLADLPRDNHGRHTTGTEEYPYFEQLSRRGIETYLWPRVICRHLGESALRLPKGSSISLYAAVPYTEGLDGEEKKKDGAKQAGAPEARDENGQGYDPDVHYERCGHGYKVADVHDRQLADGQQASEPDDSHERGDVPRKASRVDKPDGSGHEAESEGEK